MPSTTSHVYAVMVNGDTIHSICASEEAAEQIAQQQKGSTVHRFPLISRVDAGKAYTESARRDPLAFLGEANINDDDLEQRPEDEFDAADGIEDQEYDEFGSDQQGAQDEDDFEMSDDDMEYGDEDEYAQSGDDVDVVCMDVPLTLRLLEWAREDATGDEDLHVVAENLASLGTQLDEVLTMEHFDQVVQMTGQDDGEFGDDMEDGEFGDDLEGGDDQEDYDQFDDYTDDLDASSYSIGSDDEYDADPEMQSRRLGEGVETFADFMKDVAISGTTSVPSVKDIYKKKRSEKEKVYTRSEVKQEGGDDQPFKVANETTDKK